jgi:hypothetical protein
MLIFNAIYNGVTERSYTSTTHLQCVNTGQCKEVDETLKHVVLVKDVMCTYQDCVD